MYICVNIHNLYSPLGVRGLFTTILHTITPFHRWLADYDPATDEKSPFFGKEYNYDLYSDTIYGYYIDPAWDFIGSETLYIKLLFVDYDRKYAIIEMIGAWIVLIHRLLHESQPEHVRIKEQVATDVGGNCGDVMQAVWSGVFHISFDVEI